MVVATVSSVHPRAVAATPVRTAPAGLAPAAASAAAAAHGVTRWRRSLAMLFPCLVAVAFMAHAMLTGSLPVAVAVTGQSFSFSAGVVHSDTPFAVTSDDLAHAQSGMARIQSAYATMDRMCLVMRQHLPGTNRSVAIAIGVPGTASMAANLDLETTAMGLGGADLQGTRYSPIQLGSLMDYSHARPQSIFQVNTGGPSTLHDVQVQSKSAMLATSITPARGAHISSVRLASQPVGQAGVSGC